MLQAEQDAAALAAWLNAEVGSGKFRHPAQALAVAIPPQPAAEDLIV